jgi:beta-lactamase class A
MTRRDALLLVSARLAAQEPPAFAAAMRDIEASVDGVLGAAALNLNSGRLAGWRAKDRFPLIEMAQLPVALHAFAQMELGELPFRKMVSIEPGSYSPGHSPLRDRYPQGVVATVGQLLEAAVRDNDASASDFLLALCGGPGAVQKRMARWFGEGLRVDRSLAGLDAAFRLSASRERFLMDERDTATPEAVVMLMSAVEGGQLLHAASHERLRGWMRETPHGAERIRPELGDALLYHKSGSTSFWDGRNIGMSVAGVAELPGGRGKLALALFLKGTERDLTQRERALAAAAGVLYRWFAAVPEK